MIQAAGQKVTGRCVEVSQHTDQQEEIDGVEEAESDIRNGSLNRLQFFEIAKHPGDAEIVSALDVEQIVICIDQDPANGK